VIKLFSLLLTLLWFNSFAQDFIQLNYSVNPKKCRIVKVDDDSIYYKKWHRKDTSVHKISTGDVTKCYFEYKSGYFIENDGLKIYCTIKDFNVLESNNVSIPKKIHYKFSNDEEHIIKTKKVSEILIGQKLFERIFINYSSRLTECIIKGKLSLYKSVIKYQNPGHMENGAMVGGGYSINQDYYLKRNGSYAGKINKVFFKKDVMPYVSDCEKVYNDVKNNKYSYEGLYHLVRHYKKYCTNE